MDHFGLVTPLISCSNSARVFRCATTNGTGVAAKESAY
jgi:hypothetical protein